MADGRRSLKRNFEEILVDNLNSEDDSEYSDVDDNNSESEYSDDDDPLYHSVSENQVYNPVYVYDNSDRAELNDLSTIWTPDTKPLREFEFLTDLKGEIKANISATSTPRDVFNELFTKDIINMIVNCTNGYGKELYAKPLSKARKSPKLIFRETDESEMNKFLGLTLLMAQCKFPTIRDAFSKNPLYFHPVFPATMSGRRYQTLLRTFNCHTPAPESLEGDKLVKVKRLVEALIESFNAAYTPGKDLSLDESLLLFRGRLSFRQYNKTKAAKYGIKFYELTTSDGYVLMFVIYQGKESNSTDSGSKTQKLVLNLMDPYLNKGHHVFMDNFYNSVTLSNILLCNKTHTTGMSTQSS
ncbi:piggyBac transposable element-derived protein 4-like [Bradysia coprophila]|uniref:piggyBac transposable element-derived protein 4-like n=1 Tax=Bradysia coprophila TaxID=38358 RepID=UPI00187DAF18|nr:piggyBac transposable element-derived protein 4-like [Bradysia coprophila]